MKKKHLWKPIVGLFIVMTVFITVTAASAGTRTLKYATMNPPTSGIHVHGYAPWAEKVEQVTEGRVKVKIYPAQTLGKARDFFDLVKHGIADIALGVQAYNAGQFPLSDLVTLPLLDFPSASVAGRVMWEIYEKFPEVQNEYEGIKLLYFATTDPYHIATLSKQVRTLEDMKGLKLRVPGGRMADTTKTLGGTPVMIPISDLYLSLEKGVIDGTAASGSMYEGLVPAEKLKHVTVDIKLWSTTFWVGMNERVWEGLSSKDQEAIMSISGKAGSEWFSKSVFDNSMAAAFEIFKKFNTEVYQLPNEERARWQAITQPIHTQYLNDLEAKGLPAREVYNEIIRLTEVYK